MDRERLTGMDATMLSVDSSRFIAYIGACVVLDGRMDLAKFTTLVEERLHLLPLFRRKLAEVPLGLGLPYWVDDPDFDLEFHLRESAIPAPGTPQQLADMIGRTFSRPLDRTRPLWEMWLVHGLEGGKVALLTKFHHALVDGVSGNEMLATLMRPEIEPSAEVWRAAREPHDLELLAGGLFGIARDAVGAVRHVPSLLRLGGGDRNILELAPGLAPRTPFNRPLSAHRRYAYGTLPLERIKRIKNEAGVTVNDVVVTLCGDATRRWLLDNGGLPDDPLLAAIPVSVRTGDDGGYGNKISMMTARVAIDGGDRLAANAQALRGAKERHGAIPAETLTDLAAFVPPAVSALATRTALGVLSRVRPPVNLLISNVPGPRETLYLGGAEVCGYFPVPPIVDGVGLNYTVVSYKDEIGIGITTDRDQIPDPFVLLDHLEAALDDH